MYLALPRVPAFNPKPFLPKLSLRTADSIALKGQLQSVAKQISGDVNFGPTGRDVQAMIVGSFKAFVGSKELYDATTKHITNYIASDQGKEILRDAATSEDVVKVLKVPVLNLVKPEAFEYVKGKLQDSPIQKKPQSKLQLQPETPTPTPTSGWLGFTPLQQNTQNTQNTQDSASSFFGPRARKRDERGSQTQQEKDKRRRK
ncbi:hypothetical protein F4813DRAFT_392119 [Daldinia decipiens]|uniref:uncharacterized protein n=1 Tax=Daldinia decipiens TaxID=326647 RepID=UPI0020C1C8E0|nr:uncharacterized protein F4813DRAFT_392119 [Daldinia decipiens]KAI1655129.1 hypothetical protein F4813DRAFT_392119 [Daldinia decipiens]